MTAISLGFSCRSKTVVKKLVNQNANIANKSETKKIDGVMYHLPKTMVQVTVPVNKVSKAPGEFADFAPCFFSVSEREGMIIAPSKSFSVGQPNFSSRGVPDTSATYVIKTKGKFFESKSLFVDYAPGYVLQQGKAESKDETLEFTAKAIATAAGIAAKIVPLALSTEDNSKNKEQLEALGKEHNCLNSLKTARVKIKVEKAATLITKEAALMGAADTPEITALRAEIAELVAQIAEIDVSINNTSADINQLLVLPKRQPKPNETARQKRLRERRELRDQQQLILNQRNAVKTPNEFRNRYQTALQLFIRLTQLITQRDDSLASPGPVLPETYKQLIEKNAEAIAAHRAAFLGGTSKESWAATFEFDPKKGVAENYSPLLFSYSTAKGICNNGQLKEKSIPINPAFAFPNKDTEKCSDTDEKTVQALWLKIVKSDDQGYLDNVEAANENAAREDKSRGWFYRVPANGVVTLQTQKLDCQPKGVAVGVKNSCLINDFKIMDISFGGVIKKGIRANYEEIVATVDKEVESTQFARNEMMIAQLGVVASVPASTAGRSSITEIMLDSSTGAMKNYKSSSSPLVDKAILDDVQKAANSTIDAADPLNRKKRELEEIELQTKINEAKKKLANTNTGNNQ